MSDYDYEGEFIAGVFTNLMFMLGSLDDTFWVNTPQQKYEIALHAERVATFMDKWGLRVAASHTRELHRILDELSTTGTHPIASASIHDQVMLIRSSLHIELESTVFAYVPSEAVSYFREPLRDVSDDVQKHFSSTLYDLTEAAKCYALSRSTACVSHCMRVLEVGLIALGESLQVPEAKSKNWANLLDQIEKRIKGFGPADGQDWRAEQEFYQTAATQFGAIRVAWRNNVMHAHEKYVPLEAREVLGSTRAFMRQIATKLHD